jgi:hypothetical protein
MYTTSLTAEIARQHQSEMRATAGRLSLARLLRRPPEPAPRPAPSYGGVTAVPTLPRQRTADDHTAHAA